MFLFLSFCFVIFSSLSVLTQYNILDGFDAFRTVLPSRVQYLGIYSTFDHFEFLENCVTFDCVVAKRKTTRRAISNGQNRFCKGPQPFNNTPSKRLTFTRFFNPLTRSLIITQSSPLAFPEARHAHMAGHALLGRAVGGTL